MDKRFGVAIPCYDRHLSVLKNLLDSIEAQTVKPSLVVVSCSSMNKQDPPRYHYSFPVEFVSHVARLNAAQNRNIAADRLLLKGCDYISFFDADDVMHPQRIEALIETFKRTKAQSILHNYIDDPVLLNQEFEPHTSLHVVENEIRRSATGCAEMIKDAHVNRVHQSQVSVSRDIFLKIRFREGATYERREDALFCGDVMQLDLPNAYIKCALSKYFIAGQWFSSDQKEKEQKKESKARKDEYDKQTVVVTLTDAPYYAKCVNTIHDIRQRGKWKGDLVVLCVDFDFPQDMIDQFQIITQRIRHVDHEPLFKAWITHPLPPKDDNRHYKKVTQWDKLQVFSAYFLKWNRVLFMDAGMRVFNPLEPLWQLPYEGRLIAPDDSDPHDNKNRFECQVCLNANPPVKDAFLKEFGSELLQKRYFLNCVFLFDTTLLKTMQPHLMREWMYRYPIMGCNEMGIMNLFFRNVWSPLPIRSRDGHHYLFGWNESCWKIATPKTNEFCLLKYPSSPPPFAVGL